MWRSARSRTAFLAAALGLLLVASACGGAGDPGGEAPSGAPRRGGTLRIASSGDVDSIDPGRTYYNVSYMLFRVMIRTLVSYPALGGEAGQELAPDIAADTGQVSDGGMTYTFRLRDGVRYQPETAGGREVRSADFRYAIERGFKPSVANGYASLYFRDVIVGDTEYAEGKADHISGIDVSDPSTIVFRLRRPSADFLFRLALPLSAPVPEEYAAPLDAETPSGYGRNFASTGPYMLERRGGEVTGYEAGKRIVMVRNPNWAARTDAIRKAYPDRIEMTQGFEDASLATRQVLNARVDLFAPDLLIPPAEIRRILASPEHREKLRFSPSNLIDYVALNTTIEPFDDPKVRQAVNYVMDKNAMRLAFGGPRKGRIATHVLIPGLPGFAEAGGVRYDPYPSEGAGGDPQRAAELMRQAGHADGKYSGPPLLMVGANTSGFQRVADVVEASLAKIGINVRRESYEPNVTTTSFLSVPEAGVAVAPDPSWFWDYPDAVTVMRPLFDGRLISPTGNNNFSLLNDAQLNALMDRAAAASGPERARLWAEADHRVMELAPVVPWLWETAANPVSARVAGFIYSLGFASPDLAAISVTSK